ncbi:MCE family protein [Gordonia rhizosphera]|uniref:Mce family protein n=1 Tax=Gordonia rhizosphera NBRC 16068 TaxID=1108045 RepID=K6V132_9ACTN|nr:MCE family protein [Gordonia rhizosphera]GAB89618.1 Mce family protein [Gordonia rhizosphera NBRC 16068]
MTSARIRLFLALVCVALLGAGCQWNGVNSLPLPGTVGTGTDDYQITVEIANVGTLSQNSPVLINDVEVGSVGPMRVTDWHAVVEVRLEQGTVVAGNAVATVGQTSLLGSMHLSLDPSPGTAPVGRTEPGATIPLDRSSSYPSTEETLASVSAVVNGGGLGQLGGIIKALNDGLANHESDARALVANLATFVTTLNRQRDDLVSLVNQAHRVSGQFADQNKVIEDALRRIPPGLEVLQRQLPHITTALDRLRVFSVTTTGVVNQVQSDLLTDLRHLEPTLRSLADVGNKINSGLAFATVFPYSQFGIDQAVRGDYMNLIATIDLTVPRLRRELLLGTALGDPNAVVPFAPGDPGYASKPTHNPLFGPLSQPKRGPR